jgi:hypothetical protein
MNERALGQHDEDADLHTMDIGIHILVHPHTARGYEFLLDRLGHDMMLDFEFDISHPFVLHNELAALVQGAEAAGLTLQCQYAIQPSKN